MIHAWLTKNDRACVWSLFSASCRDLVYSIHIFPFLLGLSRWVYILMPDWPSYFWCEIKQILLSNWLWLIKFNNRDKEIEIIIMKNEIYWLKRSSMLISMQCFLKRSIVETCKYLHNHSIRMPNWDMDLSLTSNKMFQFRWKHNYTSFMAINQIQLDMICTNNFLKSRIPLHQVATSENANFDIEFNSPVNLFMLSIKCLTI